MVFPHFLKNPSVERVDSPLPEISFVVSTFKCISDVGAPLERREAHFWGRQIPDVLLICELI
jgi:hypothetical protein